ncbi:MAG: hypothetical protein J6Q32_05450 [Clostridia bacterium]|nr:hypothetical protein [Clostridia bacterium]
MVINKILNSIKAFLKAGGDDLVFLISALLLLFLGTIFTFCTPFKRQKASFFAHLIVFLNVFIINFALYILGDFSIEKICMLSVSLYCVSLVAYIPSLIVSKKRTLKKEEKELINFIDKEMAKGLKVERLEEKENLLEKEKQAKESVSIDFSHVKGVIKRLEFYPLSVQEKKQVKELEKEIFLAESQGSKSSNLGNLNDYLTILLKIMAKYGV